MRDLREKPNADLQARTFIKTILTGVGASVLSLDPLMANSPQEFIPPKINSSKKWIAEQGIQTMG